ncbi:MAG: endonuclease/exonuclease/phosphatase family protein [Verrucomicrobiae bacterium]|nr:endonuclease/exonuclease/phosphatase family protein [Verrucomicrobiae bacterium]
MKVLAWNVNRRKLGRPHIAVFRELGAETILLNEFVDGKFRQEFSDDLRDAGFHSQSLSEGVAGVRAPLIFAASKYTFHAGDLAAPKVDVWSSCNFLHIKFENLEMVGLRVPCYERNKKAEAAKIPDYWQKLGEIFDRILNRNILFAGDFNADPSHVFGSQEERAIVEESLSKLRIPDPAGEWSFKRGNSSARIDHVAHTEGILVRSPEYISTIGDHVLAGVSGVMSDHAGLLFDVEPKDSRT